jgi:xanthine dehydrogenase YagS FAD-binding subunit
MNARFEWTDPKTVEAALGQLGEGAVVKAGGVDLMDRLKEGLDSPRRLVNILRVPGLAEISEGPGGLRIGALVTLAKLASDPLIGRRLPALRDAAQQAATPNLRNAATLGGNLLQRPRCWYFRDQQFPCLRKGGAACYAQDGEHEYHALFGNSTCAIVHPSSTATPLLAYGASVEVASKAGRRSLPLGQLFVAPEQDVQREHVLKPDELLTAVIVPVPPAGARSAYGKLAEKESFDWPLAETTVVLEIAGGRVAKAAVALGAAAPVPLRASGAEKALVGQAINAETARAAAKAALLGATPLARNGYRLALFETLLARTILKAAEA